MEYQNSQHLVLYTKKWAFNTRWIELIEAINGIDQIKDSILDDLKVIYPDKKLNLLKMHAT